MILKNKLLFLAVTFTLALNASQCFASWLIYHKPEFKGRVIDADTKEPIEGAVAVVVYKKHTLISGPGGGYASVVSVKETLTDKNGDFYFPSYTTLIQPNSIEDYAEFIIYRPGYGSLPSFIAPEQRIRPPIGLSLGDLETFFSKEIGSQGEVEISVITIGNRTEWKSVKLTFGIVELPKLKTREERLKAQPSAPTDIRSKELPLLFRAINAERRRFGLDEVR